MITMTQKTYKNNMLKEEIKEFITKEYYDNMISSIKLMRRLGGKELVRRSFTCNGIRITRLTSICPDATIKIVRDFDFS
jgi:hypothetical protein